MKTRVNYIYGEDRQRFLELIPRVATGIESPAEFEEFGVLLIRLVVAWERGYGVGPADEGCCVEGVFQHIMEQKAAIAAADDPWNLLWVMGRRKVQDILRSTVWRHQKRVVHLESNDGDETQDTLEDSSLVVDAGLSPALVTLLLDDWAQVEQILARWQNSEHAVFFREWASGQRKVDIAAEFECTQNTVQLAVERVHEFVLKELLAMKFAPWQSRLIKQLGDVRFKSLAEWLTAKNLDTRWLAKQWGVKRKEALEAICALVALVMQD